MKYNCYDTSSLRTTKIDVRYLIITKTFVFQKPRGRGAGSASNSNNNNSLTTSGQTSTNLNNKNDNSSSAITKMDTSPIPGNRNINVSKFF